MGSRLQKDPLITPSPSYPPKTPNTLPNLKGRDLFDSMIWSDPLTTSIFYTFIASLRRTIINDVNDTTHTHKFLRTLRDGGRLVRVYTQNIDGLEGREGLHCDLRSGTGDRRRFRRSIRRAGSGADTPEDKEEEYRGGVECVQLHGSLDLTRCGLCSHVQPWDEPAEAEKEEGGDIEPATSTQESEATDDSGSAEEQDDAIAFHSASDFVSAKNAFEAGQAPGCRVCLAQTHARHTRGKRGLSIGTLRPDIVLYGEEHPSAHLIAPLITHDISLCPDVLLILGTSLRVHGLKVMVKEFAKTVHARGGRVVFVNKTKMAESIWRDVIDYWVDMDCDDWVLDLNRRRRDIWLPRGQRPAPPPPRAPVVAKRPTALRPHKENAAWCVYNIRQQLQRITGLSAMAHGKAEKVAPSNAKKRKSLKGVSSDTPSSLYIIKRPPMEEISPNTSLSPATAKDQLPTPPTSSPHLTPRAQRIKRLGSIDAILSSPTKRRRSGY